jgi:hypothetical protein
MKSVFFILLSSIAALDFSPEIALRNLHIAASTYCNNVNEWKCVHCIDNVNVVAVIPGESTIVIVDDIVQNATVVAIRGSTNINNWIHNFEFEMTEPYTDNSIKVHKGLYAEYLSYKDEVMPYIKKSENIIFTGHSSGGAVAMFFAYDMEKSVVYSFGKPRIGNDRFADTAKHITHYRITHANDIVPHLPEEVFGYRHTETEIWFPTSTEFKICNGNEDKQCSNSCAPLDCISTSAHLNYMGVAIGSDSC